MTDIKKLVIPDPVDLPPGSRPAWRAVVQIIDELRDKQNKSDATIRRLNADTTRVYLGLESQAEVINSQQQNLETLNAQYIPQDSVPAPTDPILTTALGTVSIEWNGLFNYYPPVADGSTPEDQPPVPTPYSEFPGFRNVIAQYSPTGNPETYTENEDGTVVVVSDWVTIGQPLNSEGVVVDSQPVGSTAYYRLVATTYTGATSEYSEVKSIVVEGVAMLDLDAEINDAIQNAIDTANEAMSTADGKTTISPNAPTVGDGTGKPVGALWWHRNNSTGQVIGMYEWTGSAWVQRPMGSDAIASDAITDAKIATGAVLEAKLADASVATAKLKDSAVSEEKIANLAVGSAKIANAAVVEAKIGDLAVSTAKIKDAAIVSAKIADAQITTAKIDDLAVTDAKIANINAGKITAGEIDAARIGANTITADKITIADFTNFASGSDFEDDAKVPWLNYGPSATFRPSTTNAHTGTKSMVLIGGQAGNSYLAGSPIPVQAGDKFYVEFWMCRSASWDGLGGNSKLRFGFNGGGLTGVSYAAADMPAANTWYKKSTIVTVPDNGTTTMGVMLVSTDSTTGNVWLDDIIIRRMSGGELIVDGAITTDKIAANAVTANELAANAVTANSIEAGAVTGTKISGDAIDGKTITGATIRTAASGQRLQLDTDGLKSYSSAGAVTATLASGSGGLWLDGGLYTRNAPITVQGVNSGGAVESYIDLSNNGTITIRGSEAGGAGAGASITTVNLDGGYTNAVTMQHLRLSSTANVSLSSTAHALQIGDTGSGNLAFNGAQIQARDNGNAGTLTINGSGGTTIFGGTSASLNDFRIPHLANYTATDVGSAPWGLVAVDDTTGRFSRATGPLASGYIPNLSASKVTAGQFDWQRIPHMTYSSSNLYMSSHPSTNASGTYLALGHGGTYALWLNSEVSGSNVLMVTHKGVYDENITTTRRATWVSSGNVLGYASSSRTKKQDLGPANLDVDALRQIPVHHYHYLAELAKREEDPDYHVATEIGSFAEDLHDLGLWQFVQYEGRGEDAVPQGIHYEMLSLAAISLGQSLADEVDDLRDRLDSMEQRLASLEAA